MAFLILIGFGFGFFTVLVIGYLKIRTEINKRYDKQIASLDIRGALDSMQRANWPLKNHKAEIE